jgi:hypothetical protein
MDPLLGYLIAATPGLLVLIWQIVKFFRTEEQEKRAAEIEVLALEAGIIQPLQNRIRALEAEAAHREQTRMADNMMWARKAFALETRIARLEAQVIRLGEVPVNGP